MVADQASTTEATGIQGGTQAAPPVNAPATPPAGSDDVASLRSRLERTEAELTKTRQEAAAHRVAKNEQRTAAEKAAEEQGQYKALAESLKARVAELEPLEGSAKQWREYEARETTRLAKARDGLEPHWQAAIDAQPTIAGKQAILDGITASRGAGTTTPAPPTKAPPSGAPGGAPAAVDWQAVSNDQSQLQAAIARDPQGWQAYKAQLRGPARPLTTYERMQQQRRSADAKR